LVARQNVVLDMLLNRISSFATIERALTAIERRLSSQGFGSAGAAAPRVGIFVDVPNIIYAAERIGVTIDFGKLLHWLTRGRELVRASAYAPISDDPQQRLETQKFVQPFVRGGYRIVTKPLKRFADGTMKGNFDVELAMDILTMSDRLDVVSLVSGDGDFSHLVELVGSKGVRVEVVAFGASTSADLRAICDDYIELSTLLNELT
ncbi:MAG: NYN domain-containing protein, partial [Dehalococcoidia bacterium]